MSSADKSKRELILVLDFGSQYSKLISRRVREVGVYSELVPADTDASILEHANVKGIILSGGPGDVHAADALPLPAWVLKSGVPILGICYGMQLIAQNLAGSVSSNAMREYGIAELQIEQSCALLDGVSKTSKIWMSHGDTVTALPTGFKCCASTDSVQVAAMCNDKAMYGIQFHPEVSHTVQGMQIIKNFAHQICGCRADWNMGNFVDEEIARIRAKVGEAQVVCAVSGGVDSTVTAALLQRAIGSQLKCIFVDTGLLREGEVERVHKSLSALEINLKTVDASKQFLQALAGITDPEEKRICIGKNFIDVFTAEAKQLGDVPFLAQGTLYSDVIESQTSDKDASKKIKSHHNVGGLPKDMKFKLIEPLNHLFKDEVRELGLELGINREQIFCHPFPGPGLAIRIIGAVDAEKLEIVRKSDTIVTDEIRQAGLYDSVWQAFTVLTGVRTVGVMGDNRTYYYVVAIRVVESRDAMTANWFPMPPELLAKLSSRIVNEVEKVNRVVFDITNKPPGTIEWE